jgi:LytR cell envelope-related transcriptional attenuator
MTARRLVPPLGAVGVVAGVIVLLLVLNSRPTQGPSPALASARPLASSASSTGSTTVSAGSPVPTPPVSQPPATQPPVTATPSRSPVVGTAPVTVLNNSRRTGLAHEVAGELAAGGWPIAAIGNLRGRIAMTTVYYAPGQEAIARRLAVQFPAIRRIEPRLEWLPSRGLTLVVTRDWP